MKKIFSVLITLLLAAAMFSGCCAFYNSSGGESQDGGSSALTQGEVSGDGALADNREEAEESADNSSGDDQEQGEASNSDADQPQNSDDNEQNSSAPIQGDVSAYIVGNWAPYTAVDSESGEKVSLKAVFGSDFNFGGTLSLNADGSFESNISGRRSGNYAVEDMTVVLTYDDGNTDTLSLTGYPDNSKLEQTVFSGGKEYTVGYAR